MRADSFHDRECGTHTIVYQPSGPITGVRNIADRLKWAREKKGLSQPQLAAAAGVSPGTIGNIESGHRKQPRELLAIAAALGVEAQWLKDGVGPVERRSADDAPSASNLPENAFPFRPRLQRVYVCGTCQGGIPDRVWEGSWKEMAQEYAEVASSDPAAFLCEVEGNSMAPRYMPREFALIEPGTTPEIEDDVLVRLKSGETMLKRLLGRRSGVRLGSYNDPEIITFADEEVEWIYYSAHPVPRRKIRRREDMPAG